MKKVLFGVLLFFVMTLQNAYADTNTVSSTVVTDKTPPTASAPSVVINNSDVCKLGLTGAMQTSLFGVAAGISITDENCERIKLARSLFGMGMKVAAVSLLCQDARVFEAMEMAGTPCPYKGKIGEEAKAEWDKHGAPVQPEKPTIEILRPNKEETQYKAEPKKSKQGCEHGETYDPYTDSCTDPYWGD